MHAFGEVHETSFNEADPGRPSVGSGVGWIAQRLPFQRSTKISCGTSISPTAKHVLLEGQDSLRTGRELFGGAGIDSIDHALPFQRSATGTDTWPFSKSAKFGDNVPIAIHVLSEEHDTACKNMIGPEV